MYDVVVADARAPRDGRFIEKIGRYNPNTDPATIIIDEEKAFQWVMDGAQPTDTVRAMLKYRGVMYRKHLQLGVNKGAITQEAADEKFAQFMEGRDSQVQAKRDRLAADKAAADKARLDAETKVKEARTEALRKKQEEAQAAAAPEASAEEAPAEGEAAAEESAE